MNEKTKRLIHTVYGAVLSLLIVITGVCLIVSCVTIYKSGDSPFTRASVAEQFSKIAIPVWICVAAVIGGIVPVLALPTERTKLKGSADRKRTLAKLRERIDFSVCTPVVARRLEEERIIRIALRIEGALLSLAAAMPALGYLLVLKHFTVEALNADILAGVLSAVPFVIIAAGCGFMIVLLDAESVNFELAFVKRVIAAGAVRKPTEPQAQTATNRERALLIARIAIVVIGVALVVVGILNGGMRDVLGKAIKICTECIGLG